MLISKDEWTELHDRNEAGQEINLNVGVSTVDDAGEGEQFCALVDFGPKPVLETLLGIFQC